MKPNIQMPETPPPIIKAYKHFIVHGGQRGVRNTGVHLNKGDFYSIIATGGINMCPKSNNCDFNSASPATPEQFLMYRIGDDKYNTREPGYGYIKEIFYSGFLYLGYRAKYPQDDTGVFNIDIIVWAKKDYDAISDFYKAMKERNPDNEALQYAFYNAEKLAQATKEIEVTKKEIETLSEKIARPTEKEKDLLSGETRQDLKTIKQADRQESEKPIIKEKDEPVAMEPGAISESTGKQTKITQMKIKLGELKEQLVKLDEMKKRFEEEKKKSTELSKKLEEKEKKEQKLLNRLKKGSKAPPVIVIAAPGDNSKVEVNVIELNGVVEDEKGIKSIDVYINGKPVKLKNTRGMRLTSAEPHIRYDFRERIPLQIGENNIRIVAVDAVGFAAEKVLTIHYSERRKNIWAVIAGIDRYPHIRHLKYAVNDAKAFYNHLVDFSQVPTENVTLLLNQEASLTRLRSTLGTHLKNNAGQDDMVIIFFAGHGATEKDMMSPDGDGLEKYLLPFDADPKDLYATALPMGEISRIFNRIRSDRLVFIADSCYSGASGGRTIGINGIRANLSDAFFDRVTSGKGRVIISASGANEVSAESDELKQGVFTYYLLEGLKGKADIDRNGLVTVDEAFRFVSQHVPRATGQEQHPIKKSTVKGRLVLSVIH